MLKDILQKIGFSPNEAEIYLATLHLGTKPASVIARKTGFNRITTYQSLEKMVRRGVISYSARGSIKNYTAAKPERIAEMLEREKAQSDKRIDVLRNSLSEFEGLINPLNEEPKFKIYSGIEGIKTLYETTLTGEGPICSFLNGSVVAKECEEYLNNIYLPKRIRKGIPAKVLMPNNWYNQEFRSKDAESLRECRFVPESESSYDMEINIFDNKVAFLSYKEEEMTAALIDSRAIFNTMSAIFDSVWKIAE